MCFSAEASFVASAATGVIGIINCKRARGTRFILLAMIPLIFSFQQLTEGTLWLHFQGVINAPLIVSITTYSYLTFAYIIWPVWFPISLFLTEKQRIRKWVIFLLMLLGIVLAAYFIRFMLDNHVEAGIVNNSIQYSVKKNFNTNIWYLIACYTMLVVGPCLLSSVKYMPVVGVFATIAWIVTEFYFSPNFTSVWCFFSAFISLIIYFAIRENVTIRPISR